MMKIRDFSYCYILLGVALLLSSCIRDEIEPCPPLQVNITVKDKNYFNVDQVEFAVRMDENLPFKAYIPTLHYMLRDLETGEVVEELGPFTVSGDEKSFPVTFCDCIPHGKYILTVWGGLNDLEPLTEERLGINFHPDNMEGNDIYIANDTLLYDAWNNNHTIEMERTKGQLLIQAMDLPNGISRTQKSITALYGALSSNFEYSSQTWVETENRWNSPTEIVNGTSLAPSISQDASLLKVSLYDTDKSGVPPLFEKSVKITLKRNEITALRYKYDEGKGDLSVYLLVDAAWQQIVDLEIDENEGTVNPNN